MREDAGFSLVEVMVATLLLATSLTALAQLFAIAARNNVVAKHGTVAAVLAAQKLEELRADPSLSASPSNTLQINTDGYADIPRPNYIRRWSVEQMPASGACVVQVLVTRRIERGVADRDAVARAPEEARVITITRQP